MQYKNNAADIFKGFLLGVIISFLLVTVVHSQQITPNNNQLSLDNLFELLKESKNEEQARAYETQIWQR